MGGMKIVCLTADPGQTTLYGLVYGYSSLKQRSKWVSGDVMILIKSQANPSNISDIQWSPVSTFPTSTWLTPMITIRHPELACAVNSAGVFTALTYGQVDDSRHQVTNTWNGIRYNPSGQMEPEYNVTGGGVWSTVDVSSRYNMTETPSYERAVMFYVKEGEKEMLAYAFSTMIGPKYEYAIQLGYVNENTSPPTLEPSTLYKNDTLKATDTEVNLAYGNGKLYAYFPQPIPRVMSITLSTRASPAAKPTLKLFTAESTKNCQHDGFDAVHSGTWNTSYFLLCTHYPDNNNDVRYDPQLDIISSTLTDTKTTTLMRYSGTLDEVAPISFFQPIGGHLPGQEAFAVISLWTKIQGITLTGSSAGTRQNLSDVFIDGIYGDGSGDRNSRSIPDQEVNPPSSNIEWGAIIAAIVFVVLIAGLLVLRRVRERRKKRMDNLEPEFEDLSKTEQDSFDSHGIQLKDVKTERTDGPIGTRNVDEAEVDDAVPLPLTGFSTHPRPNVITCIGSSSP
ncbi:hypothetical protein BGZ89_005625 [Linnemannia elongata]|nr:hypothetical protein BGZ89_005625 [Linnemannia elongata]